MSEATPTSYGVGTLPCPVLRGDDPFVWLAGDVGDALNPAWGNAATNVSTIRAPAGTTIYEGAVVSQPMSGGGSLMGGGNHVYIPRVDPSWLVS